MAGTVVNLLLLGFLFLAAVVCIVAPLGVLGVMFWHWHKELDQNWPSQTGEIDAGEVRGARWIQANSLHFSWALHRQDLNQDRLSPADSSVKFSQPKRVHNRMSAQGIVRTFLVFLWENYSTFVVHRGT